MAQERTNRRLTWLGYGACAMAGCLWGTGFYFGKLALREMSVGHMVLYRFLFATLGMMPIFLTGLKRRRRSQETPVWTGRDLGTLLLSAALGLSLIHI